MSHIFGKLIQTAYVVPDIEAALKHWTENLGIGPWFYRELVPIEIFMYRGEPSDLKMSIALGYSGDMQYELIQQRNDAPSVYKEFIETIGYGQQHLGFEVDDLDASIETGRGLGYQIEQEGTITNSGSFAYMSKDDFPGTMIEFLPMPEARRKSWATIQSWSVGWNGSDPVRASF